MAVKRGRTASAIAKETDEKRKQRLTAKRPPIFQENDEQRQTRLSQKQTVTASQRSNETTEHKHDRLETAASYKADRRRSVSPEIRTNYSTTERTNARVKARATTSACGNSSFILQS